MPWTPLADRFNDLPLVLAGPILRRTEPDAVTVWVALKEAREVRLNVFRTRADEGHPELIDNTTLLSGSRRTVSLGEKLHVVAVTARLVPPATQLVSRQIYAYNLLFGAAEDLVATAGVLSSRGAGATPVTISYFPHLYPTFALPPEELSDLRLIHGSCRKPHDTGGDALAILDDLIDKDRHSPITRPHLLFLTGDQIYAEEVMDLLLWLLMDASSVFVGWEEQLPGISKPTRDLMPGMRTSDVKPKAGLYTHSDSQVQSHILTLGEYYAMYLFAWSQVVWPDALPAVDELSKFLTDRAGAENRGLTQAEAAFIGRLKTTVNDWNSAIADLQEFVGTMWRVRRALANIPVYMIFDDHDVTDDWYLTRSWCENVLSTPLGRRLVENALTAYSIFQAWGSTPAQFEPGQNGEKLLTAAAAWTTAAGIPNDKRTEIDLYVGLTDGQAPLFTQDGAMWVLRRDAAQCLKWHYTVRSPKRAGTDTHPYEVIVLDTRTWRAYPDTPRRAKDPPALMSASAFTEQLDKPLAETDAAAVEATFVIAPTNPIGLPIIDWVQAVSLDIDASASTDFGHELTAAGMPDSVAQMPDTGDAWNFHAHALATLLAKMFARRERVVVLSGDIHFGYALRLLYWARRPYGSPPPMPGTEETRHVLAQLTSSALKNADFLKRLTKLLHTKAKWAEPEQVWVGWTGYPNLRCRKKLSSGPWLRIVPADAPVVWKISGHLVDADYAIGPGTDQPDWRYRIDFAERKLGPGATRTPFVLPSQPAADNALGWLAIYSTLFDPAEAALLTRTPWFQEGSEIVGLHNIGVVTFEWPDSDPDGSKRAVIQDLYFWPPGAEPYTVSRYRIPLKLVDAPPPLPAVP